MSFQGPTFVLAIIAMSMAAWVITTAIRARHGYPIENEWGGKVDRRNPDQERAISLLSNENDKLKGQIARLEERIAVLERIATDRPGRLAEEIDRLR
ncbi:MAG: hypothetical protein DI623_12630 [Sphingomonas sanxanigenens]|uniref:Uncharacterized protein n=1 Tax=Sphingomonas sanxanigenens TaxID=397260 RepID=A0A2W5C300_9SPHN|nr:MAG: hypothetical protein DI623_12630 [Sphingomonas sanxanigenens]